MFICGCAWGPSSHIPAEAFCIDPLPSYSGQRQLLWCEGVLQDLSGVRQPHHIFVDVWPLDMQTMQTHETCTVDRSEWSDACFSDVQDPTAIRESLRSSCRASTVGRGDFQLTLFQSYSWFFPFQGSSNYKSHWLGNSFCEASPIFVWLLASPIFVWLLGEKTGYVFVSCKYVFEPGTSHNHPVTWWWDANSPSKRAFF